MIKFAYTILYVQDVEKSMSFYETAFGFSRKFIVPGNTYGELDTGNTTLSFASIPQATSHLQGDFIQSDLKDRPFGIEIAFTTDDVEGTVKKAIKAGAREETKATVQPHGQTVAYVRDPDGFLVEICSPMD